MNASTVSRYLLSEWYRCQTGSETMADMLISGQLSDVVCDQAFVLLLQECASAPMWFASNYPFAWRLLTL